MIELRYNEDLQPAYMSQHSSGCDLRSKISIEIWPRKIVLVPTSVFISHVEWEKVPEGFVPEIQIRARSGLALRHGIGLPNGVGTIDADYRDEISVILTNFSDMPYTIQQGERIAQMVLNLVPRFPNLPTLGTRTGGFGSTGR
ncbi:MAG: dUTP diphosphatase [Oligoflexales bacterium]